MRALPAILIAFALMGGCGTPVIDMSSPERSKESVEAVTASLSPEDQKAFEDAMKAIALIQAFEQQGDEITTDLAEAIDGKTAAEVIALAEAMRLEREAKQAADARKRFADLLEECRPQHPELLTALVCDYAAIERGDWGTSLKLEVTNAGEQPISAVTFLVRAVTPGRSVAWDEDVMRYEISGGLEPGESASWSFSTAHRLDLPKDRDDVLPLIAVLALEGPDEAIIASRMVEDYQAERLASIHVKHPDATTTAGMAIVEGVTAAVEADLEAFQGRVAELTAQRREAAAAAKLAEQTAAFDELVASGGIIHPERLAQVRITYAAFAGGEYPKLSLEVTNGTGLPITAVIIEAKAITPGRAEPWTSFSRRKEIEGGLEPGETTQLDYYLSNRRDLPDRQDVLPAVAILKLEGPGDQIVASRLVSERTLTRLRELHDELGTPATAAAMSAISDAQAAITNDLSASPAAFRAAELERLSAAAAAAAERQTKVTITAPTIVSKEGRFRPEVTISFTIANSLDQAVRKIYLHGIATAEGSNAPLLADGLIYELPAALPPGSSQQLNLSPNMMSDWAKLPPGSPMALSLDVVAIQLQGDEDRLPVSLSDDELARLQWLMGGQPNGQ